MVNVATKELTRAILALVLLYLAATVHLYRSMMGGGLCGHGHLDGATQECVCKDRYTGPNCKLCSFGLKGAGCWSGDSTPKHPGRRGPKLDVAVLVDDAVVVEHSQASGAAARAAAAAAALRVGGIEENDDGITSLWRVRMNALAGALADDDRGRVAAAHVITPAEAAAGMDPSSGRGRVGAAPTTFHYIIATTFTDDAVAVIEGWRKRAKDRARSAAAAGDADGSEVAEALDAPARPVVVACWLRDHAAFATALNDPTAGGRATAAPAAPTSLAHRIHPSFAESLPHDLCDAYIAPSEAWLAELTWRKPVLRLPTLQLPRALLLKGGGARGWGPATAAADNAAGGGDVVLEMAQAAGIPPPPAGSGGRGAPILRTASYLDVVVLGDHTPARRKFVDAIVPVTRTTGREGYRTLVIGEGWDAADAAGQEQRGGGGAAGYKIAPHALLPSLRHSDAPWLLSAYAAARLLVVFDDDPGFEPPGETMPVYAYDAVQRDCVVVRVAAAAREQVPRAEDDDDEADDTREGGGFLDGGDIGVMLQDGVTVATPAELRREVATLLSGDRALLDRLKVLKVRARSDGRSAATAAAELVRAYSILM